MNLLSPIRFQVNKRVEAALKKHHPWIYRNQCSSALDAIPQGSILRIVGTKNNFLGFGIYEPLSAIAVRVFSFQDLPIDENFFFKKLQRALEKRQPHVHECNTNAYRLLHGEADAFPGVTMDVFDRTAVMVFHIQSWRPLLENSLKKLAAETGLEKIFIKAAHGKNTDDTLENLLTGMTEKIQEPLWFVEDGFDFPAYPASGLKTGFFLDLREVRLVLPHIVQAGDPVLNLFANDGTFSAIATKAGAKEVTSVERHEIGKIHALEIFKKWRLDFAAQNWITGDVWEFLKNANSTKKFNVILLDPPSLASKKSQEKNLKKTWEDLHTAAFRLLSQNGYFISISCTERLSVEKQIQWTQSAAHQAGIKLELVKILPPNFDHPEMKNLPERNYFRAMVWRNEES